MYFTYSMSELRFYRTSVFRSLTVCMLLMLRGSLSSILWLISDQNIYFALALLIDYTWWPSNETLKCCLGHFESVKIRKTARHVALYKVLPKRNVHNSSIKKPLLFLAIVTVLPVIGILSRNCPAKTGYFAWHFKSSIVPKSTAQNLKSATYLEPFVDITAKSNPYASNIS